MFFIGTHIGPSAQIAVFAVIRKTLKNVRNHYQVIDVRQAPADQTTHILADMYRRSDLIVRKRVFSQDRRPKKEVNAHPRIVLCGGEGVRAMAAALRSNGLPVENVLLNHADAVTSETPARAGIGTDYHVPEDQLWEVLSDVVEQGRANIENGAAPAPLIRMISRALAEWGNGCSLDADNDSRCALLAVAAPVWFRETVRYTQAYRTSATSKRRFI